MKMTTGDMAQAKLSPGKKRAIQNIIFFIILFCLYIFRTPDDLFSPYLWAEDGTVLISGSIYDGISMVFETSNGTYWVLQRVLALFCYFISIPFGTIAYLPYIQMFVFKAVAVLGIAYFLNDRFSWIVSKRLFRFFICAAIILMIPQGAIDVTTCDTSLPFILFFDVFLIGLDLLCREEEGTLSILQAAFLALISVSYAGGIFVAIVVLLIDLRWVICRVRKATFTWKKFAPELIKTAIILIAVFVQLASLLSDGRVSSELELLDRIAANTKAFVFFPYWQELCGWGFFALGIACWAVILWLTKLPKKTTLYCAVFSWSYMLYCSLAETVEDFYPIEISASEAIDNIEAATPRYYLISIMIATFITGCAAVRLVEKRRNSRSTLIFRRGIAGVLIAVCVVVSILTYKMPVLGDEFADDYEIYQSMYEKDGEDALSVPIGPTNPWVVRFPMSSMQEVYDDLEFGITYIMHGSTNRSDVSGYVLPLSLSEGRFDYFDAINGWAHTKSGETFTRLLLKTDDGEYRAANALDGESFDVFVRNIDIDPDLDNLGTVELYGQTKDGQWHRGTLDVEIVQYEW